MNILVAEKGLEKAFKGVYRDMANHNANQPDAITPEFNSRLIKAALTTINWKSIDLHDINAVKGRIDEYFNMCDSLQLRPSNLGFYAALGLSRQDIDNIITGKSKSKVNPACIDMIQKARVAISSYREQLAMAGKVSPPIAIFWAKNFDGMQDITTVQVAADTSGPVTITADEARAALEDMPIDVEYSEKEDNCT